MILGFALVAVGYSVFYWGIHHYCGVDCSNKDPCSCRHSLIELLGIPKNWNVPGGKPVFLSPADTTKTQQQQSNNATTNSSLTGNSSGGTSSYQTMILSALGAPTSQNNISKLAGWNQCEGNEQGASGLGINNPFNTTLSCCNATGSVNSAGVKAYPSLADGVNATVQTLQSSLYTAIVQNLQSDGSPDAFAAAVGGSPWGTSGQCIQGVIG